MYMHDFWWTKFWGKSLKETDSACTYDGSSNSKEALNSETCFDRKCRKYGKWGHKAKDFKEKSEIKLKEEVWQYLLLVWQKGAKRKTVFTKEYGKPWVTISENSGKHIEDEVLAYMCEAKFKGNVAGMCKSV